MKALLGLLFGICIVAISIYLNVEKKIEVKALSAMFVLAIAGGLAIANYDVLKRWKGLGFEVETALGEIQELKSDALSEIEKDVVSHKESIKLLITQANQTSDKLKSQEQELQKLIKVAQKLQNEIQHQKESIVDLNQDTKKAKDEIVRLNKAASEIALTLIKATYFNAETKGIIGGPKNKKAAEVIENDINRVLAMVFPDPAQRNQWVENLMHVLPK